MTTAFNAEAPTERTSRSAAATPADPALMGGLSLLECYARALEESGDFRVLRRLPPRPAAPDVQAPDARLALFVDCETTGLDPSIDEVIEIAAVPFQFSEAGRIIAVHEAISQLREPARPIPAHVTELTGIDAETVAGRTIDEAALRRALGRASLVIAHNSKFDRPFLERLLPAFAGLPWACSMAEVPWREEGLRAVNLPALAAAHGFFYDAHRATDDCLAAIEILGRPLPRSGRPALSELLRRAASETWRVWAVGSPFEARAALKARGYRWSNGEDGRRKSWHVEVGAEALEDELSFLRQEIGLKTNIPLERMTALERFSARG